MTLLYSSGDLREKVNKKRRVTIRLTMPHRGGVLYKLTSVLRYFLLVATRILHVVIRRLNLGDFWQNKSLRFNTLSVAAIVLIAQFATVISPFLVQQTYALGNAEPLLTKKEPLMADNLKYDTRSGAFNFDTKQTIESGIAHSAGGGVSATAYTDIAKGIAVTDSTNKADFKLTPKYRAAEGQKDGNRIIYPLYDQDGWAVYTMTGIGTKEDIVLKSSKSDEASFEYDMNLGDSLVAKVEPDGSVGIYGNTIFSGNISTGTAKDAALLKKARQNAEKTTRMFVIPAPTVKETGKEESGILAKYEVNGTTLKMDVTGLKEGSYPLTIDPSIYVVTAYQFMYGNNESNINFDVTNKLIKKNPTSGARFSSWQSTTSLPQGFFGGGTVASGGYLYQIGGNSVSNSFSSTISSAGTSSYTVPAGVTSITVKAWGGGGGGAASSTGGGAGFVQSTLSVTPGETLTIKVAGGGGAGAGSIQGSTAGGGGGYSGVFRGSTPLLVAGGGGGGGSRSSAGMGGGGGCTTSGSACDGTGANTFPGLGATASAGGGSTPGSVNCGTLNNGSAFQGGIGSMALLANCAAGAGGAGGINGGGPGGVTYSTAFYFNGGGGGGGGYYGGGGGGNGTANGANGGGGGGGSSYATGSNQTITAGSGTTPGNSSDTLRGTAGNGGSTSTAGKNGIIVIDDQLKANGSVYWAQFDTGNGTVTNANPGNGTCGSWCSSSNYGLPVNRSNLSVVAYNGYLYAMGGNDESGPNVSGHKYSTIYVAKLGANGEPRLWHPTDSNQANWVYWYHDDVGMTLPAARIFGSAVAYNNKMYFIGGLDDSTSVGVANSTVWVADILPNGKLGSWSTSTALTSGGPGATYGATALTYNDKLYLVGGAGSVAGTPFSSNVYYISINSDGSLGSSWTHTNDFATGRVSGGGTNATIWGGYMYVTGGCSVTDSNNYCSTILSDTQVASINADGSLGSWVTLSGVTKQTMGTGLIVWRNNIYAVGGCATQSNSTGGCTTGVTTGISYSPINSQGEISPMSSSSASGAGTCTGATPTNCDVPATGSVGNINSSSVVNNGYLYVLGGCTNTGCSTTSSGVAFTQVTASGDLVQPSSCPSGSTATNGWCVMNTGMPGNVAEAAATVFNDTIYMVGGNTGSALTNAIYRATVTPSTGLLSSWSTDTMSGAGATSVRGAYATTRANPSSVSTNPGNMYIIGGCATANCSNAATTAVYKCNITTTGSISSCSTSGQVQLPTNGLAFTGGTVYANYIYLIGGYSTPTGGIAIYSTTFYAKFDSSNNIVTTGSSGWTQSSATLSNSYYMMGAYAYNGYLYTVGGIHYQFFNTFSTTNTVQYIKINPTDGSLDTSWTTSGITLSSIRYGNPTVVSNGRAYSLGGCGTFAGTSCSAATSTVQSFKIYNNDSGNPISYAQSNSTGVDAIGADSVILNGYIYRAGGCTAIDCSSTASTVYYAPIGTDGTIGTWSTTTSLPAARSWGKLLTAGGSLYYVGGNDSSSVAQSTIYYATPSSGTISSWSTASNGLPGARARFGAAVWNNRLYVVGGIGDTTSPTTATLSTAGSGTFHVPAGVSSITVKAWGGGGGGGVGAASTGVGGSGGGGGFAQTTLSVTPDENLTYYVGTGGAKGSTNTYGGSGGGFSGLSRGSTYLIQAAGGGGGGGTTQTASGGAGGAGGGASGSSGSSGGGSATVGGGGGGGTNSAGGTAGTAGTSGVAGAGGGANTGGDGGGSLTNCTTTVTGTGGAGGTGGGGKGGVSATCVNGGGGGGGSFGGGGGGSAINSATARGAGGGGGGSDYVSGTSSTETAGSGTTPGNNSDTARGTAGTGGTGATTAASATAGQPGTVVITYNDYPVQSTVYVSPQLSSGGDITSGWTTSSGFNVARKNLSVVAYANNLYVIGGDDGTNYMSDSQFAQISTIDGSVGSWMYATGLPRPVSGGSAFAANGYLYLVGGRSAPTTCSQSTLVAAISSNTTVASGNNPTGLGGRWDETSQKFGGARYGATASYNAGKLYLLGGGCTALIGTGTGVPNDRAYTTALYTQPQIAKYSISFDTDTNVYPQKFLVNGVDYSLGSQWQLKYRTMSDPGAVTNLGTGVDCSASPMTGWGQQTSYGNLTLGSLGTYSPLDGSGINMSCGRYYFLSMTIDAQNAFGFPDDVTRGPTITDVSLRYTSSPQKRLLHGGTFINGIQSPLDSAQSAN